MNQPTIRITRHAKEVEVFVNGEPQWRDIDSIQQIPGYMGMTESLVNPVVASYERVLRSDTGAIHIVLPLL